ncbi:LysR family transcriptional regulator [Bordetella sp. 15P40C-2]|uniref:LysR family transcriptional regulator n=1 Tax=Bordetella sp. 15P40C-2 TaxID=2572246 RepID=UPI001325515B|nr:LysR family transcriptional regulator [Bordetella sp. 15P40C-2]MVW70875.1 LysR family transcriptional regulator [Bordetella sp. 15P40C-2]
MTLTQLRYFLAVIRCGSISGAAAQIHVAQPAISQRLRQLEDELGQVLFHRLPRGIELTAAGHHLKAHAVEILRRVDSVHDDFKSSDVNPRGRVTLAMSTAVNTKFCVAVLEQAASLYPHIRLTLTEHMSGTLLEWAQSGRVDLAVVYDVPGNTPLAVHHLGEEDLYLVSDPAFKHTLSDTVSLADIADLPLLLPAFPQTLRLMVERTFSENLGRAPTVMLDVDSTYAIKKLVSAGKGQSILSAHSVGDEIAHGELAITPIVDPPITRTINLVTYPPRAEDAAVRAVHRVVEAVLAS